MSASKVLFFLCLSFIGGIALVSFVKIPTLLLWGFLVVGVLCIAVGSIGKRVMVVGFCILFAVLGIARFQVAEFSIKNDPLAKLNDVSQKVVLMGVIVAEPNVSNTAQKLIVQIQNTKSLVLVSAWRYPQYHYLDTIKITGKLKNPGVFKDFNYQEYLRKDGIYSVMDFATVELVPVKKEYTITTYLYEKILFFKEKLRQSIATYFNQPKNSILEGIILGSDKNMPKEVRDKLNGTGLSHLTAVSGSNIVILSSIMMAFLLALGFWRGQAFYISFVFIWLYIIIAGFPASGIRAGIMGSIFLLAQKFGRQNTSSRVILLAAMLMLAHNPLLFLYDIGFQLSFLASMGIIYLKPFIDRALYKISQKKLKNLTDVISITISAQIFTLPIIAYNFKNVSLIAPLANLLVVPIADFLMMFGFLSSVFGVFSGFLGWVFAIPCHVLLSYFLKVMELLYQPWLIYFMGSISWSWLLIYYILLIFIIYFLERKLESEFPLH